MDSSSPVVVSSTAGAGTKKTLQEMSKEELIQRCRNLLALAQKAKLARDDALKEKELLKEEQQKGDRTTALEEMVQSLTAQKVESATEIDKLKRESLKLKQTLDTAEAAQETHERQSKRIIDENEHLLIQVDSLDKVLQSTKEEFANLKKTHLELQASSIVLKQEFDEKLVHNNSEISYLRDQLKKLEEQNSNQSTKYDETLANLMAENKELKEFKQTNEREILNLKQTLDTAEATQETHKRKSKKIIDENEHLLIQVDSLDKVLQSTKEEFANLKQTNQELQDSSIVLKQEFDEKLVHNNSEISYLRDQLKKLEEQNLNQSTKYDETLANLMAENKELNEFKQTNERISEQVQLLESFQIEALKQNEENQQNTLIEENNATTIEGLKDEIELLTASNGKLNHTVQDLETLNASFREENQRKTNEIQDLGANFDEKLRQSDKELSDLKEEFHKSQINHELLIQEKVDQIQQLQQMNNDLESNFKSNDLMALEKYSKLQTKIQQIQNEMQQTKTEFLTYRTNTSQDLSQLSQGVNSLIQHTCNAEQEMPKNELLEEIKEMTVELKKRSTKISDLEENMDVLNEDLKQARNELSILKQHQKSEAADMESMSTSTVSKVEETARMVDVEASFEDRYSKLKIVAIKLKKRVNEQEKLISELQAQSKDSSATPQKITQLSANFANLQLEYDSAQDTIETLKKEVLTLTKDLKATVEKATEAKESLIATQSELSLEQSKNASMLANSTQLNEELVNLRGKTKEQDCQIAALRTEKESFKEELKTMNEKLEKMSGMDKKHDLLDLELEEAEGRISGLAEQLAKTQEELNQAHFKLQVEIEAKENREMQLSELEQTLSKETERCTDLKTKLSDARSSLSDLEAKTSESKCAMDVLTKEMDQIRTENEKLSCQLADMSGYALTTEKSLQNRNESLQKYVISLETEMDRKKILNDELEGKATNLEQEFEQYKIRAQSVLKQVKEKDSAIGEKAQELASLERVVQNLNAKIADLSTQRASTELELKHVQEDQDRLMERHSALLSDMAAKERQSREKQEQLVKLANSAEKSRQDAIASLQEQTESLRQNYRSQIEDIESKHSSEVAKLQKQIDDLDNQVLRLQMSNKRTSPPQDVVHYLEREAAEGSEATTEASNRPTSVTPNLDSRFSRSISIARSEENSGSKTGGGPMISPLVPLEQLLQQEEFSGVSSPTMETSKSINNDIENRMLATERRLVHMASLLSESEAENARLTQLANVLKEEIRSYQRSEERIKHIENLEYVKNVILKFLVLPRSDEKSRLIPVLSTILKLSPSEIESIQKVVASDFEDGGRGGQDSEVGWTSYLGLWST